MNTVFYHDFTADKSLINPTDLIKPIAGFPQVCISTYSKQIIDKFAAMENVEIIANLQTVKSRYIKSNTAVKNLLFIYHWSALPPVYAALKKSLPWAAENLYSSAAAVYWTII